MTVSTKKYADDPAKAAAEKMKKDLDTLRRPLPDNLIPKELDAVARQLAEAAAAAGAAKREVERLLAEAKVRSERISLLEAVIQRANQIRHVWCVTHTLGLKGEVPTLEMSGFFDEKGENRLDTLHEGESTEHTVVYTEYAWNIMPFGQPLDYMGKMQFSDGMSDAGVYYNCAMEPGHLHWRPLWRYATLRSTGWMDCVITLSESPPIRPLSDEKKAFVLNEAVTAAKLYYPSCHGGAFTPGDEVAVAFHLDWKAPIVIGFRRKPKACSFYSSWGQLR